MLLGVAAGGAIYYYRVGSDQFRGGVDQTISSVRQYLPETTATEATPGAKPKELKPRPTWDGYLRVHIDEAKSLGILVETVHPQDQPIKLELPGRTEYDPNTLHKIRPRFDTLVERVRAELGQHVKKGDPLVDLFSTDLAAAKNDYQTAYVQWKHDVKFLKAREELYKTKAIALQQLIDTQNDELKSRLAQTTTREKLRVFDVPEEQIDSLLANLGDKPLPPQPHTISDKARMTRISPVDGIVISRDVVPGNLYDNNDVLMVIAPLDHLFVWVNVYEADQAKVHIGQELEIRFPYLNETVLRKVEYVAPEVSKDTRAIKIRTTVPNVNGELKSDMLVRAILEIPPVKGWTVIPRSAMVVMNGEEYAFVQDEKDKTSSKDIEKFERRKLVVSEERDDHVVVASGLKPGEHVASHGLILAQLYEDQQMIATGLPLK